MNPRALSLIILPPLLEPFNLNGSMRVEVFEGLSPWVRGPFSSEGQNPPGLGAKEFIVLVYVHMAWLLICSDVDIHSPDAVQTFRFSRRAISG